MIRRPIKLTNETYKTLLEDYARHVSHLGYNKGSQRMMYFNLLDFLEWLEKEELDEIDRIKPHHIKTYYEYLKVRPHSRKTGCISPKTVHHHLCNLRLFFALLQQTDVLPVNPMSVLKFSYPRETPEPRSILTIAEVHELYRSTQTLQERAILSLGYGCGLRSLELMAINVEDLRLNENYIIVQHGKGNKRRLVPINARVKNDLQQYIAHERILYLKDETQALLLNTSGKRMRKYTFNKILKEINARTGNPVIIRKNICTHNLRHSIATHLLAQGVPVEQVRLFLGHSQLETTEIYTRINAQQLKKLIQ
jgi:integrase/recombinase XerD